MFLCATGGTAKQGEGGAGGLALDTSLSGLTFEGAAPAQALASSPTG